MHLSKFFAYDFILRSLAVGGLVALCAALLGVTLVLKRYSMIGDGLSHVGFGALSIALVLNAAPLAVALPVVMAAAFLLLRMSENSRVKGDAAVALLASGALAVGLIITSLANGSNLDVHNYLFGSVLAATNADVVWSVILFVCVLAMYVLSYPLLFSVTFDEAFAQATGVRVKLYKTLIALLTAVTIVLGMRIMGTLLISSLMIFPPLTAMRVFASFKKVTVASAVLAVFGVFAGIVCSFAFSLPTGASIVAVNLVTFGVFAAVGAAHGR